MNKEFFIGNRVKLAAKMEDNSAAVFFSGKSPRESGDQTYSFSVDRNFFYLTGIDREDMVLLVYKLNGQITEQLYIPPVDEIHEKWYGILMRKEEATETSGINTILDRANFMPNIFGRLGDQSGPENIYIVSYVTAVDESLNDYKRFAKIITEQFPPVNILNSLEIMTELRQSKSTEEVAEIKNSILYTKEALEFVMKNIKPGRFEYQIKADFEYQLALRGSKPSFKTIGASGKNGVILHYIDLKEQLQDNELILLDLGALANNYASDITRTYPINGKFTARQKDIYNVVLEAQDVAIDAMKSGELQKTVNDAVKSHFAKYLKVLNVIKDDSDVVKYYYHGIGHPLGLDLHDVENRQKTIAADNVYTVEPGLYIAEEGIGIRIEDDVWVTENGIINLSKDIIKTVNDIENFMK